MLTNDWPHSTVKGDGVLGAAGASQYTNHRTLILIYFILRFHAIGEFKGKGVTEFVFVSK